MMTELRMQENLEDMEILAGRMVNDGGCSLNPPKLTQPCLTSQNPYRIKENEKILNIGNWKNRRHTSFRLASHCSITPLDLYRQKSEASFQEYRLLSDESR